MVLQGQSESVASSQEVVGTVLRKDGSHSLPTQTAAASTEGEFAALGAALVAIKQAAPTHPVAGDDSQSSSEGDIRLVPCRGRLRLQDGIPAVSSAATSREA